VKKEIFVDARKNLRLDCIDGWEAVEKHVFIKSGFDYDAVLGD